MVCHGQWNVIGNIPVMQMHRTRATASQKMQQPQKCDNGQIECLGTRQSRSEVRVTVLSSDMFFCTGFS